MSESIWWSLELIVFRDSKSRHNLTFLLTSNNNIIIFSFIEYYRGHDKISKSSSIDSMVDMMWNTEVESSLVTLPKNLMVQEPTNRRESLLSPRRAKQSRGVNCKSFPFHLIDDYCSWNARLLIKNDRKIFTWRRTSELETSSATLSKSLTHMWNTSGDENFYFHHHFISCCARSFTRMKIFTLENSLPYDKMLKRVFFLFNIAIVFTTGKRWEKGGKKFQATFHFSWSDISCGYVKRSKLNLNFSLMMTKVAAAANLYCRKYFQSLTFSFGEVLLPFELL